MSPSALSISSSRLSSAVVTALAYLAVTALAVAFTRFEGGVAFLWGANAVLIAALIGQRMKAWPEVVATCWVGGIIASGLWGVGWGWGIAMATVNVAEATLAVFVLRRWRVAGTGFCDGRELTLFVLVAGLAAPLASGIPAAAAISHASHTPWAINLGHWMIAHGLGAVAFAPCLVQLSSGEARRALLGRGARCTIEAAASLLAVAVVSIAVFAQSALPLLFLPMLPLLIATFRVGPAGASIGVAILTAIGIAFTSTGHGPVSLVHGGIGAQLQFLLFYLTVTVLTVLPVAAVLSGRQRLFDEVVAAQTRIRLLLEGSDDVVLELAVDGTIRYASPSVSTMGLGDADTVIGLRGGVLVAREDWVRMGDLHRRAIATPGSTLSDEFRCVDQRSGERWFEAKSRAVCDADGAVSGVTSVLRETTARRVHELALSRAALTDPLTGLANRRAFEGALAAWSSGSRDGCVAVFDLDRFKAVNDAHGHAGGDEVLRAFAMRASGQIRDGDVLARIGGEEFAVLFRSVGVPIAEVICERIRGAVSASPVPLGDWLVAMTVSAGVAELRIGEDSADALARADAALYEAKRSGRDQLKLAA